MNVYKIEYHFSSPGNFDEGNYFVRVFRRMVPLVKETYRG